MTKAGQKKKRSLLSSYVQCILLVKRVSKKLHLFHFEIPDFPLKPQGEGKIGIGLVFCSLCIFMTLNTDEIFINALVFFFVSGRQLTLTQMP